MKNYDLEPLIKVATKDNMEAELSFKLPEDNVKVTIIVTPI